MGEISPGILWRILTVAAVLEAGTGLALIVDPALVVALLLGVSVSDLELVLGRCFGLALLSLGLACGSRGARFETPPLAAGAMLLYNALIAVYLAYLGSLHGMAGPLLWPAVALHLVVASLLVLAWRNSKR
jgi:hypothetical protein